MNTYGKLPVAFESGDGCWLYDTDGNKYFDTFMGVAVSGLGYSNVNVNKAIKDQCSRLIHCSNVFHSVPQQKLADKLCTIANMDSAFFCNSGAEANEAAIKIARKYGSDKNIANPCILALEGGFHGRTLATLSASSNPKVRQGFAPLSDAFIHIAANTITATSDALATHPNTVAILIECIQGEGGLTVLEDQYLKDLRALCDEHQILLIVDEIQTGNGRSGKYFAYQHAGIEPDIVTSAKGLGNGFPIGVCLAKGLAASTLTPGSHGSTFGGNPLACATALAVVNEIEEKHLSKRADELGRYILSTLQEALQGAEYIQDIRGKGLMIGIEMTDPCFALVPLAKEKGILLNVTSDKVIRLLPALTISDEEVEFLIDAVIQIIRLYAADDRAKPRA